MDANIRKIDLPIRGMTCVNCEQKIKKGLEKSPGVKRADVSFNTGKAVVLFDRTRVTERKIKQIIHDAGYEVGGVKRFAQMRRAAGLLLLIAVLSAVLGQIRQLGVLDYFPLAEAGMGYPLLFVAGLLTSVHCVGMCGGICLSQTMRSKSSPFLAGALYNLGRVVSYTVIGGIVGAIGNVVQPSGTFRGVVQLVAGAFMLIMGFSMLGIFPWLNRFVPRMPAVIARKVNAGKVRAGGPFVVGLLNGLMPCGPLQSMQLFALSAGSAARGAISMLAFSLGTVPLMLGLGALASALGRKFTARAMAAGAVLVAVLGISMFSQGMRLSGTFKEGVAPVIADATEVQIVESTLSPGAYPNITVRAGTPVRWKIDAPKGSINGCNYAIIIGEYGIEYQFTTGENVIEFMPTGAGTFYYTCWMGMIDGKITVIDDDI